MIRLQVLGTGCAKCAKLAENARAAVAQLDVEAAVEKVSDLNEILGFGVPGLPALIVNGNVKAGGRLPSVEEIKSWLTEATEDQSPAMAEAVSEQASAASCSCNQVASTPEPKREVCCGPATPDEDWSQADGAAEWIVGSLDGPTGPVPRVGTTLGWKDRLGAWKARWGIGRMRYQVKPGLYAAGNPTAESSVFVSANYKMSFDRLRSALDGIDGWILVLDTKGINVWCAAGKGTFGTDELVRRIDDTGLSSVVSHKRLIVPQLGAPGVAAHEVKERSGFRVVYGPVRASDIRPFLQAAMKATPEMRRVEFPLSDRLATAPVELVISAKWVLTIALAFLLLAGLGSDGYSWARVAREGVLSAALFAGTFAAGTILTPALLPWLPGRALSLKGAWIGAALLPVFAALLWIFQAMPTDWLNVAAWCILIPLTTSVAAMSFTGATTYTSLSGVRREMKIAVPIQATAAVVGVILWLAGRFTLS